MNMNFYVAGFQFHGGKKLIIDGTLKEGQAVTLIREPHNEYDKFAILVIFGDKKLGYVPKTQNQQLIGLTTKANIMKIVPDAKTHMMCQVNVDTL